MNLVKDVTAISMEETHMDTIDFMFAYLLSLISALALTFIPDWNSKIAYLVISTAIVVVIAFTSSLVEKELK